MVETNPRLSKEEMSRELVAKAIDLWGEARAEAIRNPLETMAENLWVLAQNLPDLEQEPAFFL